MFNRREFKMFGFKVNNFINMSNLHSLEVVCRVSDTQLQVGEKLYKITYKIERANLFMCLKIFQHLLTSVIFLKKLFNFISLHLIIKGDKQLRLLNPLTAKLFNLNFHPPQVVSR